MPNSTLLEEPPRQTAGNRSSRQEELYQAIEHAAHLLPSQGPITVFVHHNTLHAFEDDPFDQAVLRGAATYGTEPYLAEQRYRQELSRGRILPHDLAAVLIDDLGDEADQLIGLLGTRYHLRLSMLQHPLGYGTEAELWWLMAETNALFRFRQESPAGIREQMIARTRRWILRDWRNGGATSTPQFDEDLRDLLRTFGKQKMERWSDSTWEAFTLHALWRICRHGVRHAHPPATTIAPEVRHRESLLQETGNDSDQLVNELLIRFCAAFVDQGIAAWTLPGREEGFFRAFLQLYRDSRPVDRWLRGLPAELERIERIGMGPLETIEQSLRLLGVAEHEEEAFMAQTILALRGWAGMLWQTETNAEWTVHPAPPGTLVEYVAVRLILERLALSHVAREAGLHVAGLHALRPAVGKGTTRTQHGRVDQRAFAVFQLTQSLGWHAEDLYRLTGDEWGRVVREIESFSSLERRRVYHLAYERRYRNQTLDAIAVGARSYRPAPAAARFQVVCCLDEREESFRRHLEEVATDCETFGAAGFFGVAMYYRGAGEAHDVPLCPVVVKPRHYVREEVVYSLEELHRRRADTRRALGKASHRLHVGSRSVLGGTVTSLLGSAATAPLVARVLFPRLTARLRRGLGSFVQPPPVTRLTLERTAEQPGPEPGQLGFNLDEMVAIVERMLKDAGLTSRLARLVVVIGHGSSSLNNPHEAAHDCGACGGARGGPNARAFAEMANDPRVRELLANRGPAIPSQTVFVGAYHNTCDESVIYYDLDRLPPTHRNDFEEARQAIDEARLRNAHERCRRFDSAELSLTPEAALRHVEGRAEDLSQVRPEYGHATNAICFVGRRERTKGLFLDRRAFLTSYDPTQDDQEHSILARLLQAVIPVCAGINLEYYFSFVDPTGYGCGTKLPHNISALLGVMDGAASDLRPGLPWQMVEIHEPVRILFVVETTPEAMRKILDCNPAIDRLARNAWIQLATLDPESAALHLLRKHRFEPYFPEKDTLPSVPSSVDWYRGWRDHLGYALVSPPTSAAVARCVEGMP